jgi:hypothetical protein
MPTTAAGAFDSGVREALRIANDKGRTHDAGVVAVLAARRARITAVCGGGYD